MFSNKNFFRGLHMLKVKKYDLTCGDLEQEILMIPNICFQQNVDTQFVDRNFAGMYIYVCAHVNGFGVRKNTYTHIHVDVFMYVCTYN